MKSITPASIVVLALAMTQPVIAQNSGSSANGTLRLSVDGKARNIEFEATRHPNGRVSGQMTLRGEQEIRSGGDDENSVAPRVSVSDFYLKVDFDCLVVNRNRAVMSGLVRDSTARDYIGRFAMLAVEDNGDASSAATRDKLSFGLHLRTAETWLPTDAELKEDYGSSLSWIATDAERPDDIGVPSRKSQELDCRTFPLSAHTLSDIGPGDGDIQVRP